MDVEPAVFALEALLEEAFQKLAAKVAHGGFRVRVHNERVRDLDAAGHFFLDPERPSGADRRAAVFLYVGTRTPTRRGVRNALKTSIKSVLFIELKRLVSCNDSLFVLFFEMVILL